MDLCDTTAMRDGEPVHTYRVPPPRRCHACDERQKAQDEAVKKKIVRPEAVLWYIEQTT